MLGLHRAVNLKLAKLSLWGLLFAYRWLLTWLLQLPFFERGYKVKAKQTWKKACLSRLRSWTTVGQIWEREQGFLGADQAGHKCFASLSVEVGENLGPGCELGCRCIWVHPCLPLRSALPLDYTLTNLPFSLMIFSFWMNNTFTIQDLASITMHVLSVVFFPLSLSILLSSTLIVIIRFLYFWLFM